MIDNQDYDMNTEQSIYFIRAMTDYAFNFDLSLVPFFRKSSILFCLELWTVRNQKCQSNQLLIIAKENFLPMTVWAQDKELTKHVAYFHSFSNVWKMGTIISEPPPPPYCYPVWWPDDIEQWKSSFPQPMFLQTPLVVRVKKDKICWGHQTETSFPPPMFLQTPLIVSRRTRSAEDIKRTFY